ncbi:MAG: cofactor-independent phosphoglycerate mutase [bacterium]
MKYAVVIGDGMADFPLEILGGRTPLEAARKPNIDALSREGILGMTWNVPSGMDPGSDVAIMSILGYDPVANFTGRGPLEAASIGIRAAADETVFRCNIINVNGDILNDYSSGHIPTAQAAEIIHTLDSGFGSDSIHFIPGISYRHILILKGDYSRVKCFPPHDHMGEPWEKFLPQGEGAEILIQLIRDSQQILESHPVNARRRNRGHKSANLIWPWGGGKMQLLESYRERYKLRGAVISAVDLARGLGVLAGLDSIIVEGATGMVDTNYEGKLQSALNTLEDGDIVFIHLEGCDEASHIGDVDLKVRGIEQIDSRIIKPLIEGLKIYDDFKILFMPDHATPIPLRTHNRDPVPFLIYRKSGVESPSGREFTEKAAHQTGVEFRKGFELMPFFLNF